MNHRQLIFATNKLPPNNTHSPTRNDDAFAGVPTDIGDIADQQPLGFSDRQGRIAEARSLATMLGDLNELDKPVIARVHGNAFGGALGLISVADIVVASDRARFGFTEVRLGLIPATIGPYVVARMGEGRARRVFFSGRLFDAGEAVELGLVGRVATPAGLDQAVEEEVAPFLSAAPGAVSRAKALVRELSPHAGRAATETTITRLADTWETAEAAEGIRAFFDKRQPSWADAGEGGPAAERPPERG